MTESDIFAFTSDKFEGWGVVVNEAMSRGCCVIGSKDTGSVPWLIQDGINGCVFEGASVEKLGRVILWCLDNPERRQQMGIAAQTTMEKLWSPQVATQRFVSLCDKIESGNNTVDFKEGPCSSVYRL